MTTPTAPTAPDDQLVAAVESALEHHGWHGITAEHIAAAAGINRVTLYRRGHTTQSLLLAAAAAAAAEFRRHALDAIVTDGTARQRLETLLDTLYDLADRHLPLLAGLYDGPTAIFHLGGDPTDDNDNDNDIVTRFEYTEPFERLLRDGNTDGTLHSADPHLDADLLFNTAGWTYIHLRRSHRWPPDTARAAVTRITTSAVIGEGSGAT